MEREGVCLTSTSRSQHGAENQDFWGQYQLDMSILDMGTCSSPKVGSDPNVTCQPIVQTCNSAFISWGIQQQDVARKPSAEKYNYRDRLENVP